MPQSPDAQSLAAEIADRLLRRQQWLATAESCTGGLIAKTLTDRPGSSGWFERGLVSYSNRSKQELLGVPPEIIEKFGAVSRETAEAMAAGLLGEAPVDWALSVTGIAGPGGGSPDKPVGLVWMAWAGRHRPVQSQRHAFSGSRDAVRERAACAALNGLLERLK